MPVARDAGAIAEGAGDRFADDIAGVLGGVVKVDVQVTDLEVSLSPTGSWTSNQTDSDGDGVGDVCDKTPR